MRSINTAHPVGAPPRLIAGRHGSGGGTPLCAAASPRQRRTSPPAIAVHRQEAGSSSRSSARSLVAAASPSGKTERPTTVGSPAWPFLAVPAAGLLALWLYQLGPLTSAAVALVALLAALTLLALLAVQAALPVAQPLATALWAAAAQWYTKHEREGSKIKLRMDRVSCVLLSCVWMGN